MLIQASCYFSLLYHLLPRPRWQSHVLLHRLHLCRYFSFCFVFLFPFVFLFVSPSVSEFVFVLRLHFCGFFTPVSISIISTWKGRHPKSVGGVKGPKLFSENLFQFQYCIFSHSTHVSFSWKVYFSNLTLGVLNPWGEWLGPSWAHLSVRFLWDTK